MAGTVLETFPHPLNIINELHAYLLDCLIKMCIIHLLRFLLLGDSPDLCMNHSRLGMEAPAPDHVSAFFCVLH